MEITGGLYIGGLWPDFCDLEAWVLLVKAAEEGTEVVSILIFCSEAKQRTIKDLACSGRRNSDRQRRHGWDVLQRPWGLQACLKRACYLVASTRPVLNLAI